MHAVAASEALDERTVGTALLSALAVRDDNAPVLLAIDDLPYLDTASASAMTFALRRMEGPHPARLLATVRDHDARLPVLQGLPSDRCSVISIGPLTLGALFDLLQSRRGIRLARPMLLRVYETSGGNPLYALELARALDRLEISPKAGTPLPVPAGLNALVDARVRDLPADVADVVAATAAAWRFTANDRDTDAIEQAVAAAMVIVDEPAVVGGARVIRAAHPLLSAAAYNGLTTARRRQLHARLAAAADDPVERVRHAALAATEPQASLAADLDVGVDRGARRRRPGYCGWSGAVVAGTHDRRSPCARRGWIGSRTRSYVRETARARGSPNPMPLRRPSPVRRVPAGASDLPRSPPRSRVGRTPSGSCRWRSRRPPTTHSCWPKRC